eukprot:1235889-Heterocapsa_arctica.AAC.1
MVDFTISQVSEHILGWAESGDRRRFVDCSPAGSVGALSSPESHIGSLVPSPAPAKGGGHLLRGLQQAAVA